MTQGSHEGKAQGFLLDHSRQGGYICSMELNALSAISPIDGRYRKSLAPLAPYFSEWGWIRYRLRVEVEYFLALAAEGIFSLPSELSEEALRDLYRNFSLEDGQRVKELEAVTNHDVKAVEYFLKEKLTALGGASVQEWVHFGLTSQDVNNTAVPLLWKEVLEAHYLPKLEALIDQLRQRAREWKGIPMLARTHGQPASPTTLGKEVMVFVERLSLQKDLLKSLPHWGKFGGATGNFNAHYLAFPEVDWVDFGQQFLNDRLGLRRQYFTTQIDHYDHLAAQLDAMKRIHHILIDLARDCWAYISLDYFKQKTRAGEVGSSAMPHKVNPIDFENAEGNLGLANALAEHLSAKLPISRLQRDLTDSTVLRNLGLPMAHGFLAILSIQRGLDKLILHPSRLEEDLEANWPVVAEAIQTLLRKEGYPQPYEALKELTRGKEKIGREEIHAFIDRLEVSDQLKERLKEIRPQNYIGLPFDY